MKNPSDSWHFYKLYVGNHHDGMDFIITEGIASALALVPDVPWFYLRYIDDKGVHIRFRLHLGSAESERLEPAIYASLHDALTQLPQRPPSLWTPLVNFRGAPEMPDYQLPVHCERAQYQPETEVYGGERGILLAEELFYQSSQIARAILLAEQHAGISRKDMALPLMLAVLDHFIPSARQTTFLESFATFWLAGSADIGAIKNSFADRAWALIDEGVTLVPSQNQDKLKLVDAWQVALSQTKRKYERQCDRYNESLAENLAFQFIHLMNNRLGFNTFDESWLAVVLSKGLESGALYASS